MPCEGQVFFVERRDRLGAYDREQTEGVAAGRQRNGDERLRRQGEQDARVFRVAAERFDLTAADGRYEQRLSCAQRARQQAAPRIGRISAPARGAAPSRVDVICRSAHRHICTLAKPEHSR